MEPAPDELALLHRQLLDGDPTAPARLAEQLLPDLRRKLAAYGRRIGADMHMLQGAINWCVARYLKEPERYDSARGPSLLGFLAMDVKGDLLNELRQNRVEQERADLESLADERSVEVQRGRRNPVEETLIESLDPIGAPAKTIELARQALRALGSRDQQLLEMIIDGVRSTAAFAAVLDISHLPLDRQKSEVKRHKDRLKKWLERISERFD